MTTTLLHHQPKTGLEANSVWNSAWQFFCSKQAGLGQSRTKWFSVPMFRVDPQDQFHVDPEAENAGFDKRRRS